MLNRCCFPSSCIESAGFCFSILLVDSSCFVIEYEYKRGKQKLVCLDLESRLLSIIELVNEEEEDVGVPDRSIVLHRQDRQ